MHKFVSGSKFMVGVSGNRTACNYSKSHEAWNLTALHKVSLKFCLIIVWSILQAHHIHQSFPTFLAFQTSRDWGAGEGMALQEQQTRLLMYVGPFAQATGKHTCRSCKWGMHTHTCPLFAQVGMHLPLPQGPISKGSRPGSGCGVGLIFMILAVISKINQCVNS